MLLAGLMLFSVGGPIQAGQVGRGAAAGACDRACLQGFVEQYLDAWIARDPARLPLAPNAKYTENGQRLELGDGSWKVGTGKGKYRLWVPDTQTGQVAVITTVTEDGAAPGQDVPSMLALRLKVVNRQISEAEALFVRPAAGGGGRGAAPARGDAPGRGRPAPPPARRATRGDGRAARAVHAADSPGRTDVARGSHPHRQHVLQRHAAERRPRRVSLHRRLRALRERVGVDECAGSAGRSAGGSEDGQHLFVAVGMPRAVQVGAHPLRVPHPRSPLRRGRSGIRLVFSFVFFDHQAGKTRTYTRSDGRVITGGPTSPWTWEIAELFRVEKSKIRRIEAVLTQSPYGQQSGWSTYDESMSDKARDIR